jgi:AraC-like DNA-binding protein
MQEDRLELIERLACRFTQDGAIEPLPWLRLRRATAPGGPLHGLTSRAFCVLPQGGKDVFLGARRYHYDHQTSLFTTAEMPVVSQITTASVEQPFFGVVVMIDPAEVGAITLDAAISPPIPSSSTTAMAVHPLDPALLDAVVRLVRTLDSPAEAGQLAPLIRREIVIRLLQGPQRDQVLAMAARSGSTERVGRAIERLRRDYDQPLRIDALAGDLGMSVSSFHHHFKAVTAMSPLQFQKHLRLQEARRLLLSGDVDATSAAFRVGYDDTSHFSREYRRQFGEPPLRDVKRLRNEPVSVDRAAF